MRITAKTFSGSIRELKERIEPICFPADQEIRTVIEDYAQMAFRRKDHRWALSDLQIHLTTSIAAELHFLRSLNKMAFPKGQDRILHFMKQSTKTTINALIQIADGIAFRFLDYNLALCQALAGNRISPYAILDESFDKVVDFFALMTDRGSRDVQALLCDINSITNVGDIIIKTDDEFEIFEVKSGEKTRCSRLNRQKARMEEITRFFNSEGGRIHSNFQNRQFKLLKLPTRSHKLKVLAETFRESETSGFAFKQLNDFLAVSCIDVNAFKDGKTLIDALSELEQKPKLIWGDKRCFDVSSLDTRQIVYSTITVPFTVFPLEIATIVDILLGTKIYISTICIEALIGHIESRGWQVVDLTEVEMSPEKRKENGFSIFHLFKPNNIEENSTFSLDFLLSTMIEFIDIECYLNNIENITAHGSDPLHWIPFYENEEQIWM